MEVDVKHNISRIERVWTRLEGSTGCRRDRGRGWLPATGGGVRASLAGCCGSSGTIIADYRGIASAPRPFHYPSGDGQWRKLSLNLTIAFSAWASATILDPSRSGVAVLLAQPSAQSPATSHSVPDRKQGRDLIVNSGGVEAREFRHIEAPVLATVSIADDQIMPPDRQSGTPGRVPAARDQRCCCGPWAGMTPCG
jgi:hypothetical protein